MIFENSLIFHNSATELRDCCQNHKLLTKSRHSTDAFPYILLKHTPITYLFEINRKKNLKRCSLLVPDRENQKKSSASESRLN